MKFIYLLLVAMGGFNAALNLATMFPNPDANASWEGVAISVFLVIGASFALLTDR